MIYIRSYKTMASICQPKPSAAALNRTCTIHTEKAASFPGSFSNGAGNEANRKEIQAQRNLKDTAAETIASIHCG